MTLQEIYDLAIQMGIKADPRGAQKVKEELTRLKKEFEELPVEKKKYFDFESLKNPYSDSRILYGDPKIKVKNIIVGIDADTGEMVLADRLNQKGAKIDLFISHHPGGYALAGLHEVMDIQVDMYTQTGVPVNVAHSLLEIRKGEVKRRFAPLNHSQAVDAARLLEIPYMSIHTIWDNLGNDFLKRYLEKKEFDTVGEILDYINEIPEFTEAIKGKAGPAIVSGNEKSKAGKIAVSFTGGTSASKELYAEMAKAGVGTLIEMHVGEDAIKELKKNHINVIDAGHISADSIGANIFLDELEKRGIKIIPCSGLIRVNRIKKTPRQ
ncbi:MAG: NGG1p interacting factor NIF3 [Patescibacteria group bacterium]|nr:NGG1p interacting factor NIF3 [Patescibacteria group bacterium]